MDWMNLSKDSTEWVLSQSNWLPYVGVIFLNLAFVIVSKWRNRQKKLEKPKLVARKRLYDFLIKSLNENQRSWSKNTKDDVNQIKLPNSPPTGCQSSLVLINYGSYPCIYLREKNVGDTLTWLQRRKIFKQAKRIGKELDELTNAQVIMSSIPEKI